MDVSRRRFLGYGGGELAVAPAHSGAGCLRQQFRQGNSQVRQGGAELAAVLRRIAELVSRDDADMGWSVYGADKLQPEVRSFLEKAETSAAHSPTDAAGLRGRFAAAVRAWQAGVHPVHSWYLVGWVV